MGTEEQSANQFGGEWPAASYKNTIRSIAIALGGVQKLYKDGINSIGREE